VPFPNRRPIQGPPQFLVDHHRSEGQEILSTVLQFVAIVLVILAILWVIRAVLNSRRTSPRIPAARSTALSELDLRYARGELDHADYLQRRSNLLVSLGAPAQAPDASPPPTPPPAEAPPAPKAPRGA
jgi:hypothetical protein